MTGWRDERLDLNGCEIFVRFSYDIRLPELSISKPAHPTGIEPLALCREHIGFLLYRGLIRGQIGDRMPDSKHLEFLHATIARIAGHSFMAKGWSITLTAAALGLAAKDGQGTYALVGLLPVTMFGVLDAYYLALEQSFRQLFVDAAKKIAAQEPPDFNMKPRPITKGVVLRAGGRPAVLLVHGPLVGALLIAVAVFR
jgi:hypothetical protein